jgi:uncharacterized protein (TIGR03382 family)
MRRFVLAVVAAGAWLSAPDAEANGRPPGASTIHFRQGHDSDIVAGMTFGLVISHDGGQTWQWMCEKAVGYGGMYDPDYSYSQSGAIFATTFDGLKVSRNGCTFDPMPSGMTFVSQDELGPDHAFYYGAADSATSMDSKIYKSTDDGVTFPQSTMPGQAGDWWESIIVAPSDPSRVYLSGYRFEMACDANSPMPYKLCTGVSDCTDTMHPNGTCEGQKQWLLFKSTNGGASFTPLPGNLLFSGNATSAGLTTSVNSSIDFVGVDHANANILYARINIENGNLGDGIYRIDTSSATSWTKLKFLADQVSVVARANGDVVLATPTLGGFKSSNQGMTWTPLNNPPHINCLAENSAGVVFACTQNYGTPPNVPSDGFGIMSSTDLSTWTGVLKFQNIQAPVTCAAGTAQQDMCVGTPTTGVWCGLKAQLGITSTVIDCTVMTPADDFPHSDAGGGGGGGAKGCCDTTSGGGAGVIALGTVTVALLLRRRKTPGSTKP